MNKTITTNTGGFPYKLDDIRWEMSAYRTALETIAKSVRNSDAVNSILWGCDVTDNTTTFDVSEGAVVISGEIYEVAAVSALSKSSSHSLYIAPSISFDPAGFKTFQDGIDHNTYQIRKAVTSIGVLPGGQITLSTSGTSAKALKKDNSFHNFSGIGEKITFASALLDSPGVYNTNYQPGSVPFRFWKRGNTVETEGSISHNAGFSPAASLLVATLPVDYRPSTKIIRHGYSYGADDYMIWEIRTDGGIYIRGDLKGTSINTSTGLVLNTSFSV